jgi:hypothetical protein
MSVPSLALRLRKCGNDACRATHPTGLPVAAVRKIEGRINCLIAWKRRHNLPITDADNLAHYREQKGG